MGSIATEGPDTCPLCDLDLTEIALTDHLPECPNRHLKHTGGHPEGRVT